MYPEWLAFFASDDYRAYLNDLLAKVDVLSDDVPKEALDRLQRHFRLGVRYERGFWEMGHRMETWPDRVANE